MKRSHFTLVEMMVSVTILLVIMGLLFTFLSKAQDAWTRSRTNTLIYENARLFFDIITRDLQSMVVSDASGARVNYMANDNYLANSDWRLAFVTTSGIGEDDGLPIEVGYSRDSDSQVIRWMTRESDGADWDFYNAGNNGWCASNSDFADSTVVIEGVADFTVTTYSSTSSTTVADSGYQTPSKVEITLELVDPEKMSLPASVLNRTRRTFTKTIFLDRNQ